MTDFQTKVKNAIADISAATNNSSSQEAAGDLLQSFININRLDFVDRTNIDFLAAGLVYHVTKKANDEISTEDEFYEIFPFVLTKNPRGDEKLFVSLVEALDRMTKDKSQALRKRSRNNFDYKINIMLSLLRYIRMLDITFKVEV